MTETKKFIREGRMGPPKTWKTGAVVSSYPRPMLVLEGDEGGLDVVNEPISWLLTDELSAVLDPKSTWTPAALTAWKFTPSASSIRLTESYDVQGNRAPFSDFIKIANLLLARCPFKTIVIDPVTRLSDIILAHLAVTQASQMADPRKWAFSVGNMVAKIISAFNAIPAHTVYIMHSAVDKNELTGEIRHEPVVYSKVRDLIGGLLSQFFFQNIEAGKAVIYTQPFGPVMGVGARWPHNLPTKIGPLYKDIYERS